MNLMLNGIEAMKDLGAPGKLTISSHQNGDDRLLVSVSDMGIGLQPEHVEQIFSPFFTSKSQGTGMGLPISRSIIESQGGRVWATASRGQVRHFSSSYRSKSPRTQLYSQRLREHETAISAI